MSNDCQLYLITPPQIDDLDQFASALKSAVGAGGVACLQLRLKNANGEPAPDDGILRAAERLAPIAQANDIAFLINDRPDLARKTGADGVHIGQTDTPYAEAREILGEDATIGVTCHDSKHLGLVAGEAGADYVAFGAFFPTETKQASTRAEIEILEWWSSATTVPCVAIGGITPENCGPLVRAGADFLAVSGAVWDHPDGAGTAVKAFTGAINHARK
ncbi:MAG: thiamine phosphate synthase [Alphaproteobacteria bacterium]|nr:thiamine phosphate synthase [Alphaproteobacteria bacterium]